MGPGKFFSEGMWIIPIFMMIVCALIFRFVFWGGRGPGPWSRGTDAQAGHDSASETPMQILQKRFARGEIDGEEFEKMKRQLEES